MNKPPLLQRVRYYAGGELEPEFLEWVEHDLVGPHASERYLVRFFIPVIPLFGLVFLLPGSLGLHLGVVAMMALPMLVFTAALCNAWRRMRLQQHDLDTGLIDHSKFTENDRLHYQQKYRHQP